MDLQTIINRTIEERAQGLYSKLIALEQRQIAAADVYEAIVAIGPHLAEVLARNHRALGITESVIDALPAPSLYQQSEPGGSQVSEITPAHSPGPAFPAVNRKPGPQQSPRKKAQSLDLPESGAVSVAAVHLSSSGN